MVNRGRVIIVRDNFQNNRPGSLQATAIARLVRALAPGRQGGKELVDRPASSLREATVKRSSNFGSYSSRRYFAWASPPVADEWLAELRLRVPSHQATSALTCLDTHRTIRRSCDRSAAPGARNPVRGSPTRLPVTTTPAALTGGRGCAG